MSNTPYPIFCICARKLTKFKYILLEEVNLNTLFHI